MDFHKHVNGPVLWGRQNGFPYAVQMIDKEEDHVKASVEWLTERKVDFRSWSFRNMPSVILFKDEREAIEFRLNFG
jgi:hypothetical protein